MLKPLLALTVSLALTAPTLAQVAPCSPPEGTTLAESDLTRLAGLIDSRTRGLAEALTADSDDERAEVSALLKVGFTPIDGLADGAYRCRTIKLGGLLPLLTYGWFECSVGGDGATLDKTSGSQRFSGSLTPSNGGLTFVGAGHYSDEAPRAYGADPQRDQVGCLYRLTGPEDVYVLELPSPKFESVHDLIVLEAK
jgi:hypothetical protein